MFEVGYSSDVAMFEGFSDSKGDSILNSLLKSGLLDSGKEN